MVGWHGFGLANLVRSMPSAELRVGSAVVSSAVSLAVCAGSPSTATSTSSYDVTCSLCPSDLDALLLLVVGIFGAAQQAKLHMLNNHGTKDLVMPQIDDR